MFCIELLYKTLLEPFSNAEKRVQGNTDDSAAVAALRAKLAEVMAAADGRTSLALEELLRNVSGDVDVLENDLLQNNPQIFRRCKVPPLRTQADTHDPSKSLQLPCTISVASIRTSTCSLDQVTHRSM